MQLLLACAAMALGYFAFDAAWGAALLGVIALVFGSTYASIQSALPVKAQLSPDQREPSTEAKQTVDGLRRLGFEALGASFRVLSRPAVRVTPLVHRASATFATVYEIELARVRVASDMVTVFDGGAMLTTTAHVEAGVLPACAGTFLQIRRDAPADKLLATHAAGVELLAQRGLRPMSAANATLEQMQAHLCASIEGQRAQFDAAPVRVTCCALWRAVTQRNPHLLPLAAQGQALRQLEERGARAVSPA